MFVTDKSTYFKTRMVIRETQRAAEDTDNPIIERMERTFF